MAASPAIHWPKTQTSHWITTGFMPGVVRIAVGYSPGLLGVLLVAHGLGLAAMGLWNFPWGLKLGLLPILILSGFYHLWQARHAESAMVRLDYCGNGWARMELRNGTRLRARRTGAALVSPWLVIVRFRAENRGSRHTCLVPLQRGYEREHRQLRVLLRHPL